MPIPFLIEEAHPADAESIAHLVNQAYRPAGPSRGWTDETGLVTGSRTSTEQVSQLFTDNSSILVMRHEGRVVACVQVEQSGEVCDVNMLATSPSLQGQGIAKHMLTAAEALAVDKYSARVLNMSVLSSRPELLAYYLRRGYALTGHAVPYPVHAGAGTPTRKDSQLLLLAKRPSACCATAHS
jgi:N-acetylglutamate synthase-like GNAT family acetyltransferase